MKHQPERCVCGHDRPKHEYGFTSEYWPCHNCDCADYQQNVAHYYATEMSETK